MQHRFAIGRKACERMSACAAHTEFLSGGGIGRIAEEKSPLFAPIRPR